MAMRSRIWLLLALAIAARLFAHGGAAAQDQLLWSPQVERSALEQTYVVQIASLNFRSQPTVQGETLSVVKEGDFLLKTGEQIVDGARWLRMVREGGQEGWVSARYVGAIKPVLGLVDGAAAFLDALSGQAPASGQVLRGREVAAGFIYIGPVGDGGWSYQHDISRKALETLPFVTSTSFVESVPEDEAALGGTIDRLVAEGKNVIFTTSYGHAAATLSAAARHPDVVFMHNSGSHTAKNVGTYFGRMYQARFLCGMIAGGMTRSNLLGYVASYPIPEVIRGINAFTLGAKSINPDIRVEVLWTHSWYAPGREREQANRLLDDGADVLTLHQDSPAVVQAAAQRGRYAIGYHSDMSAFGPEAVLTSAVWNWSPMTRYVVQRVHERAWQPEQLWWGLNEGIVGLTPLSSSVPKDLQRRVEQRFNQIASGQFRIFVGPLRDNSGAERAAAGEVMSDADILSMDFLVQGVDGTPSGPKPRGGLGEEG